MIVGLLKPIGNIFAVPTLAAGIAPSSASVCPPASMNPPSTVIFAMTLVASPPILDTSIVAPSPPAMVISNSGGTIGS